MGISQSNDNNKNPFNKYSDNIQQSNFLNWQENKDVNQYDQYNTNCSDEVFILQRKADQADSKYIYKQNLINVINQLKQYQDNNGRASYKDDLYTYYKEVRIQDKIRKIFDPQKESYLSRRLNQHNQPIHNHVERKYKLSQKDPEKTDEWGYKYTIFDSLCLALPAKFIFDKATKRYVLNGKLTNQLFGFPEIQIFEEQISNLVTHFSESLKKSHECFKKARYENQLFPDTKGKVTFDKEIRALIQIFEMEISPNQQYFGRFHKEGISVESILYSCLYILQQDQALDNGILQLSRIFDKKEIHSKGLRSKLKDYDQLKANKQFGNYYFPLGSSKLEEDLMLIFPNRNLHRVKINNTTNAVQKRLVVQISVVNHLDQPFTINDLDIQFHPKDELNEMAYEIKTQQIKED